MKTKNEKNISLISAILFLLVGIKSFGLMVSEILRITDNHIHFHASDIVNFVFWILIGVTAIITSVLLLKGKKCKLLSAFAVVNIAGCLVDFCGYILSAVGVKSDWFYSLFNNSSPITLILSHTMPEVVVFAADVILLVYVLVNCGSSKEKAAEIDRKWNLPGLLIIAQYVLYKVLLGINYGIEGGLSQVLYIFDPHFINNEIDTIITVLIRAFAFLTLCLWLKRKNENEIESGSNAEISQK